MISKDNKEKEIQELKKALKEANKEIEKLIAIKSDFVSIVSHELRTPLTSVRESVSLLLDGIAGPVDEKQKKFLSIAKNNINRLVTLITDILDFSKLDSGRIKISKKESDINILIKEIYETLKKRGDQKNIRFNLNLSEDIGKTCFDPDRISQALRNLVSNAIKFNKNNGNINIYTGKESNNGKSIIKVCVEDTGVGIADCDKRSLFKDFAPLDSSMTRNYPGLGLGLTICKRIIEFHGGDIWVESEKNIGSKFIFTLPLN